MTTSPGSARAGSSLPSNPPSPVPARPPYGVAALAALLVLAGYVITLAPTVTFWDAGEFIAAARILGIPHPPGTPLYVMMAHVWGSLVPVGEYALRLNLLSAVLSALGASCFFLVAHESLTAWTRELEAPRARLLALGGAFAAVLVAGFTFTVWQNSNETEVYAVATFTIAAICWLVLRWRAARGTPRASHLLLLILYLAGVSIGNHLLALLVGPAVVAFLAATLHAEPAPDLEERRVEWAQLAVVAGTWALLIGGGLGSTTLLALGGLAYLAAAAAAVGAKTPRFAAAALGIAAVGISSYLFLYIRSGQHPVINEAQPDNWQALLEVIRRAQYPVRTPFDDPTVVHGPENPGRSLPLFGLQLLNYLQYFDWQWANGIRQTIRPGAAQLPVRSLATVLFLGLGLRGLRLLRRSDRPAFWLLLTLFLTTGLGLVLYMNFKPGYSIGFDRYPNPSDHEVRERDYFFIVSFAVWGLWAGMGLAGLVRTALERGRRAPRWAAAGLGALALIPFLGNFTAASRRHGPDATLAADFAYNLLNSVPPHGILFTYGDNDTFPLWWAQEVQGIRRDVTVVCLALAETDWYKRQLRDNPPRPFDPATAPAIWRDSAAVLPSGPVHSLRDADILAAQPTMLAEDVTVPIGPIRTVLPRRTVLTGADFVVLRILQENLGRRPIAWSLTTGRDFLGLDRYLVQQGLVFRLASAVPDTADRNLDFHRVLGAPLDVATTSRLAFETYRYAGLLAPGVSAQDLEPTAAGVAGNLSLPLAQLAYAYQARNDAARALQAAEWAGQLSPNPALRRALMQVVGEVGESGND